MELAYYLIVFLFGTIVGSFLNVVIYRYNTGMSIAEGRSQCFSCGKRLSWHELIPMVSFLIQKGKCRGCGSKISWQYPLVEFITGILFLLSFYQVPIISWHLVYLWIIMSLFVVITVYDIKHKIIPNGFVYAFIGISFLGLLLSPDLQFTAVNFFAAPFLSAPFAGLWFFSRGTWMGFGDVKLAWGIGWFLGLWAGLSAIVFAFWIGSIFSLALLFVSHISRLSFAPKRFTMKSEIAFGPFLLLGTLIVLFTGMNVFSLSGLLLGL